ncbi:MAG: aminotransferase class I/II-fold pyridoxal phosphate-dependent enzyme, partial [Oscillospiraceae bacterium]
MKLDHTTAPLYEAMKEYQRDRVVKFDVPGHKGGRGNKVLREFLGEPCMKNDVNSMKPLDNLCHPVSVIKRAQELAADAFGAENSIFIVNGATGAVQAMVMSVCKAGDKIILPRNVHRSAINALVVCGAVPVYVNPGVNSALGIPLGMTPAEVEAAIDANPDAKAVLVNNPTYYGICSDLKKITEIAHSRGLKVLCDEAHGTHFYFGEGLPASGMSCGADMAAVSVHKTGGSLTQSALLLLGKGIDPNYVRQIINLTQTTSASYLLMASLDLARQNLALNGREFYAKTVEFADYARQEINEIGGYYAFGEELCDGGAFFAFDKTKLSVHTRAMGLAGIEVYDLLRDEYGIQIEFGDIGNILAIITGGDRALEIERLLGALSEIKRLYGKSPVGLFDHEYINPVVEATPQQAFYAEQETLPIEQTAGRVCSEFVMCYPPG